MTKVKNGMLIIQQTPDEKCELCGKNAELRPYGPNGENICFECGMKDEETTARQFGKLMNSCDQINPNNN